MEFSPLAAVVTMDALAVETSLVAVVVNVVAVMDGNFAIEPLAMGVVTKSFAVGRDEIGVIAVVVIDGAVVDVDVGVDVDDMLLLRYLLFDTGFGLEGLG